MRSIFIACWVIFWQILPMNSVRRWPPWRRSSELMLDNLDHLSQLELKELLVSLNLGIIDLQTLIDNLIEAASIEAGQV